MSGRGGSGFPLRRRGKEPGVHHHPAFTLKALKDLLDLGLPNLCFQDRFDLIQRLGASVLYLDQIETVGRGDDLADLTGRESVSRVGYGGHYLLAVNVAHIAAEAGSGKIVGIRLSQFGKASPGQNSPPQVLELFAGFRRGQRRASGARRLGQEARLRAEQTLVPFQPNESKRQGLLNRVIRNNSNPALRGWASSANRLI